MNKVFSYWEKAHYENSYDFIVVGAGFTGLSTAIHLKANHPQSRILVVEKGVVPYGASAKNAGFACFGSVGELEDDANNMTIAEIRDTVKMRFSGLSLLRKLVPDEEMKYDECGGIELFQDGVEFERASAKINFWNEQLRPIVGADVFHVVDCAIKGFYPKAIMNRHEGALNPAKAVNFLWASAQSKGIEFMMGTEVTEFREVNGNVFLESTLDLDLSTKELIVCTNAFSSSLFPTFDIQPARNQVLVTHPLDVNPLLSCYHFNKGYIYFRQVGDRILLGGARNISTHEGTEEYGNTEEIQEYLTRFLYENISTDARIDHWWSGIIATGSAKKPLIGRFSDHISFGLRLSGMGVAIGTFVGKKVAELH